MTRLRNFVEGSILALIAILIFFVALEIVLRLTIEKKEVIEPILLRYSENPELFYEFSPGASRNINNINFTINSKGMRDYEIAFEKPKDVYRIAVLGDSVALGVNVNLSDTFPKELEKLLNKNLRYKKFEVLNFAVLGYGTKQEAELLKTKVLKFNPDVVIITYVLNDPEISTSLQSYFSQNPKNGSRVCKIHPLNLPISCRLSDFINSFYTSEFFYSRMLNIRDRFKGDYFTNVHKDKNLWKNIVVSFTEIKDISNKNGIGVIIVIFPVFYGDFNKYQWSWIHEKVKSEAEENGFFVLDLLETYKNYNLKELKITKKDILHPNKQGHRIAAEEIYEFLNKNNLTSR